MRQPKGLRYYIYLDSEKWRQIAETVKERDGWKCTLCGSTEELQVHHITYAHVYHEEDHLDDLVTLCKKCHFGLHDFLNKRRQEEREKYQEEKRKEKEMRMELISLFVETYKHLDYAFGGPENLCKYDVSEKYWLQLYGHKYDDYAHKLEIQGIFRDFKIDTIHRLKAEGKRKAEVVKAGIPWEWVNRYWNKGREVNQ